MGDEATARRLPPRRAHPVIISPAYCEAVGCYRPPVVLLYGAWLCPSHANEAL
jgi:hypothetical protein